ncbi:organic cation transporter protein-like isoform X2 [Littorina saxatilis]|uniref:organic cation transporter protein-like isoform X2 n=1 Tax=Littorina saxatilis TaxID=31220 RepID=UPI0038B59F32
MNDRKFEFSTCNAGADSKDNETDAMMNGSGNNALVHKMFDAGKNGCVESGKEVLFNNGVDKGKNGQDVALVSNGSGGGQDSPSSQDDGMTYDGVLTLLGEFGRYQKWMCFLLCLPSISGALQIIITVFTLAVPDHRCALPGVDNDTWQVQHAHHAHLINVSIPPGTSSPYSKCKNYSPTNGAGASYNGNASSTGAWNGSSSHHGDLFSLGTESCSRYVYDQSLYASTVTTQMNLVCERSLYRSHSQMMVMLGSLMGSQLIGLISDMWGRKIAMMLSIVLHVTSAFALTWARNYVMLMIFNVPLGMSVSGFICSSFVLSMELVGPSKRVWPGYGIMAAWSVGMMLLAPLAYWLRDWSNLQLATAILAAPLLSYWWLIPESPRWLLSKNRVSDAERIVARAARVNKVTLPPGLLEKTHMGMQTASVPLWKACSNVRLFFRHLIIFFAWFVTSTTYYGLSWNVGTLGGSVYVNLALSGAVELVSFVICILLLDRIGRRALCCGLLMIAGVTCTATLLPVLYAPPYDVHWCSTLYKNNTFSINTLVPSKHLQQLISITNTFTHKESALTTLNVIKMCRLFSLKRKWGLFSLTLTSTVSL